jgi:dTMP kinase
MPGLFIVFEGIDGSGQDTQAMELKKHLETLRYPAVWLTHEPSNGPWGMKVRAVLRGEVKPKPSPASIQAMMSRDRRWHVGEILKHLKADEIVICVRYLYSTLAYGQADGVDYTKLWELNKDFIRPDIAIYLDLNPAEAMARVEKRGKPVELFERQEFLDRVRVNFHTLCHSKDFPEFKPIRATGSIDAVHSLVWRLVEQVVEKWDSVKKPE